MQDEAQDAQEAAKRIVPVIEYERAAPGGWTMQDVAFIAVRIISLWTFLGSLVLLAGFVPHMFVSRTEYGDMAMAAGIVFVALGAPVAAWIWSRRLARLILSPINRPTDGAFRPQNTDLLSGALAVAGVYLAVSSCPQLAYNTYWMFFERFHWTYTLQPLVSVLLGIGLFLGSPGLARLWRRLRSPNPFESSAGRTDGADQA